MQKDYQPGLKVQLAIASHRYFSYFQTIKVTKEGIDVASAARSFGQFKNRLKELNLDDKPESGESHEPGIK